MTKTPIEASSLEMAVTIHQSFQKAKPHDYHKPFEETDKEYQRVMVAIGGDICKLLHNSVTQDRANTLAVLRHKVDGMQLINKGETEDTPVCDNESCSAFNAYNQALKDVEVLLQETLGIK